MRCPECSKFASYDEPEAELQGSLEIGVVNAEVDDELPSHFAVTLEITGDVRVVLKHDECGTELKEATFGVNHQIDHGCYPEEGDTEEPTDGDFSVDSDDPEGVQDTITTIQRGKRRGQPIKNARYFTTTYGYTLNGSIECSRCGHSEDFTAEDNMAASSMDEMV